MKAFVERNSHLLAWVIAMAMLIEGLDGTVLATALPGIAANLKQDPVHLKLALTCYLLSLGMFMPVSGWLADRFSSKRVFITAILVFIGSSIGCGLSNHLYQLVIMRIFQGIGGAMMVPVGRLIIIRSFPKNELVRVMNQIAIFSLIGPAIGPTLGGFVVQNLSWRLVFFINVPVGLVGALLVWFCLPCDKGHNEVGKFDVIGGALFGLGIALLLYAFQIVIDNGMKLDIKAFIFVCCLIAFGLYYRHYRSAKNPMLNWHMFQDPIFKIGVVGMVLSRLGTSAMPFLIPLLYQLSFGFDPFKAGAMLFPMTIGSFMMLFALKPILRRWGYRKTLIVNSFMLALVSLLFTTLQAQSSLPELASLLLLYGILFTLQTSSLNTLAFSCIQGKAGDSSGSSIISTIQQISSSFGITIASMVIRYLSNKDKLEGSYIPPQFFHAAFFVVSLFIICSAISFFRLPHHAGEEALQAP